MSTDQQLVAALLASVQGDDDRSLALLEQAASQANPSPELLFALGSDYVERADEAKG